MRRIYMVMVIASACQIYLVFIEYMLYVNSLSLKLVTRMVKRVCFSLARLGELSHASGAAKHNL